MSDELINMLVADAASESRCTRGRAAARANAMRAMAVLGARRPDFMVRPECRPATPAMRRTTTLKEQTECLSVTLDTPVSSKEARHPSGFGVGDGPEPFPLGGLTLTSRAKQIHYNPILNKKQV